MLTRQLVRDRARRRVPNTLYLANCALWPVFCICTTSVPLAITVAPT